MANQTVTFEFVAELKKATAAIDDFSKNTQKQLDSIKTDTFITSINQGFELAGRAYNAVSSVIGKAIAQAIEAEDAQVKLANSMRLVGDFSSSAMLRVNDFAKALSETTTISNDGAVAAVGLAKSFRLTNDEALKVVKTASDLSAVTGKDLNTSVEELSRTYNGLVSRDLKSMLPMLQHLTIDQLAHGEAVDIVAGKYKDTASVLNDTLGGALKNAKKAEDEFYQSIGKLLQDLDLVGWTKAWAGTFNLLGDAIHYVTDAWKKMGDAARADPLMEKAGIAMDARMRGLSPPNTSKLEQYGPAAPTAAVMAADKLVAENKKTLDESLFKERVAHERALAKIKLDSDRLGWAKAEEAWDKQQAAERRANIEKLGGVAGNMFQGTAGAAALVSQGAGLGADMLLPGSGQFVTQMTSLLAQGPEKTKEMLDGFIQGIPTIIENIVKSLPVLIEELVKLIPEVTAQLAADMPKVAEEFMVALVKAIPNIAGGAAKSIAGPAGGILGKIFHFAEGGKVPDLQRFMGDKYPAFLNAGEEVLTRESSSDLSDIKQMLREGGSGGSTRVVLQIGEKQLADVMLNLNRQGFRT